MYVRNEQRGQEEMALPSGGTDSPVLAYFAAGDSESGLRDFTSQCSAKGWTHLVEYSAAHWRLGQKLLTQPNKHRAAVYHFVLATGAETPVAGLIAALPAALETAGVAEDKRLRIVRLIKEKQSSSNLLVALG